MKTSRHTLRPIGLAVAVACGALVAIADVAPVLTLGEIITVTGTADAAPIACSGIGTVACPDLRSAIAHADGNGNEATAYDKIVLANGSVHTLTVADTGSAEAIDALDNTVGDLDITTPMNIETADPAGLRATIQGGEGFNDRLLQINAAVKLDNLVLTKGQGVFMNGGAIYAGDTGNTTINNSVITGNKATWDLDFDDPLDPLDTFTTEVQGSGGGIYSKGVLTITQSTLSNNSAYTKFGDLEYQKNGNGGAIYASQATTIVDSTIGGDTLANTDGSSVGQNFGNLAINGGGIQMAGGNKLEVLRSTLSFNNGVSGGGINVVSPSASPFTVTNSTISNNYVTDSGAGINTNSSVLLSNSTIAFNKKVSSNKGSGLNLVGGTATIKNTLLVDNVGDALATLTDANCGQVGTSGLPVLTQGGNLSTDGTCNLTFSSDQQNVADAKLDTALALNDNKLSETRTHALLDGSPALDKGVNDGCPSSDQRGFLRPFDYVTIGTKVCDVGAYEAWIDRKDLSITSMIAAPAEVLVNSPASVSVELSNNSTGDATNVTLRTTLPTGVSYQSGPSSCSESSSLVTCNVGTLAASGQVNISMEVLVKSAGVNTITSEVLSDAPDLYPQNNTASVTVLGLTSADLNLTASNVSFVVGAQGQITYTVLNQSGGDAKNVVVSGAVPDGLTLASITGGNPCSVNGSAFSCTLPEVLAGETKAVLVTVGSSASGTYNVPASVTGDVIDSDSTDNAATAAVTVTAAPVSSGGGGGGCSAADGQRPVDPVLPALGVLGLLGWALRRVRRG